MVKKIYYGTGIDCALEKKDYSTKDIHEQKAKFEVIGESLLGAMACITSRVLLSDRLSTSGLSTVHCCSIIVSS